MPQTILILVAKGALVPGKAAIKGVAFAKPKTELGYNPHLPERMCANKIKLLFPVTPYLLEYWNLRKKVNYKKLKHPELRVKE